MSRLSNCELAERLIATYDEPLPSNQSHDLPSPQIVGKVLLLLRELFYPGFTGQRRPQASTLFSHVESQLGTLRVLLSQQVFLGLHHRCQTLSAECPPCETEALRICDGFMASLPELRRLLLKDVQAAYDGDPAAKGLDEVIFSYPGLRAVTVYRVAHLLHELGAVVVPRMMTEQAHAETGIDIHPGAKIGESFFIDHGTGVVIGETSVLGNRVRIYQGVTLGALSLPRGRSASKRRHPTIEDDVVIYANATILGGDTVIGKGAVIGGNTWVVTSVPEGAHINKPCT